MRFSRSLAVLACIVIGAAALYFSYEASSAGSVAANDMNHRLPDLGSLLNPTDKVSIREFPDPVLYNDFVGSVHQHPAFLDAQDLFLSKGMEWDYASEEAFQAHMDMDGVVVDVYTIETFPYEGSYGVFTLARDNQGYHHISKMLTNIGRKAVIGDDPIVSEIPVYVYANGMPVYYVYVWHWIGGWWYPYYYWWHDSHNHPNWYYSYYNYWWWRYYWYDYYWVPWFNWYYCWWYWRYFYYWSTWFPY